MFTHPDSIGRLAREHHHEMIAEARQRQLCRQARPASGPRTGTVTRRLAAAFARFSVTAARVADAG
jgi:hypothetical protein